MLGDLGQDPVQLVVLPPLRQRRRGRGSSVPVTSASTQPPTGCGTLRASRVAVRRSTSSAAGRPGPRRWMERRRTGRVPANSRPSPSAMVTPSSSRSSPAAQVLASTWSRAQGRRCGGVQAPPDARVRHPLLHRRTDRPDREGSAGATGGRDARSSTSDAVTRAPARSRSWTPRASSGLVWRTERSARRTRSRGRPVPGPSRAVGPRRDPAGRRRRRRRGSGARTSRCRGTSR